MVISETVAMAVRMVPQTSPSASGGRTLTQGRIFDRSGRLVAAVTQEGLSRRLRAGAQSFPVDLSGAKEATDAATGR